MDEFPKRLQKVLEHLKENREKIILVYPAIPKRYMDERSIIMARMGMFDETKISSWLVVTDKDLIFVRTGLLRKKMDRFPLEKITDIEYIKEFYDNTLKIKIGDAAEDVRFYDEVDGLKFYQYIKNKNRGIDNGTTSSGSLSSKS
ncbi:MAG: PH domain-containing protein [Methanotrichaceae archaeon]